MESWAKEHLDAVGEESYRRFNEVARDPKVLDLPTELRAALLDFIADFAKWENSASPHYLAVTRVLTQAAHEALGGAPGTRPLVIDPFAGGGSIPLEALRVGADAFASDLNPIPVLLNTIVLEYIPKYGRVLADEVQRWASWIKSEAENALKTFYPTDDGGGTPVAYLWARTIRCEGPGCGSELPLLRSLWLAKKPNRSVALRLVPQPEERRVDFRIAVKRGDAWYDLDDTATKIPNDHVDGTVRRGAATCPCCGYTTPVTRVREQLTLRRGGSDDARMLCVVTQHPAERSVSFRLPNGNDFAAVAAAARALEVLKSSHSGALSVVPDEPTPLGGGSGAGRAFSQRNYGMDAFENLFNTRQLLALATFGELVQRVGAELRQSKSEDFARATCIMLSAALGKLADYLSTLCVWRTARSCVAHTFGRQAIPITWDFGEMNPFAGSAGDWEEACRYLGMLIDEISDGANGVGVVARADAVSLPLPDNCAAAVVTDPPYYDAVPYSDLSDYFYVWHKRALQGFKLPLLDELLTPKADEYIVDEIKGKDSRYFEYSMQQAMSEARRAVAPAGIGVVVFAHKSTAGWEALLKALIDAGWIVTGSWPIDTERPGRMRANASAALASSVHLVCRPREDAQGGVREEHVGEWREVLRELPRRIHEWMPRLAEEGVVGADAIFACLGPALEVFSRYSRVEKASGETVTLSEYLEHVWAAVAQEALSMVLDSPDTSGLEPDGRLTAIWLWTAGGDLRADEPVEDGVTTDSAEDDTPAVAAAPSGFVLEFDAARKLAQGLGARLDELPHIVQVKGEKARLLPVAERVHHLFGKSSAPGAPTKGTKKKQLGLFADIDEAIEAQGWGELGSPEAGKTILDRIHQAMLLFAAGRGEALKRFLVEEGSGNHPQFWKLAQSLSALYPAGTDEKRWVDGVLARKKSLGFA